MIYKRRLMILLAAAARRAAGLQQARAASLRCSRLASTVVDDAARDFRAAAGFQSPATEAPKRKRVAEKGIDTSPVSKRHGRSSRGTPNYTA